MMWVANSNEIGRVGGLGLLIPMKLAGSADLGCLIPMKLAGSEDFVANSDETGRVKRCCC